MLTFFLCLLYTSDDAEVMADNATQGDTVLHNEPPFLEVYKLRIWHPHDKLTCSKPNSAVSMEHVNILYMKSTRQEVSFYN